MKFTRFWLEFDQNPGKKNSKISNLVYIVPLGNQSKILEILAIFKLTYLEKYLELSVQIFFGESYDFSLSATRVFRLFRALLKKTLIYLDYSTDLGVRRGVGKVYCCIFIFCKNFEVSILPRMPTNFSK